MKNKPIWNKKQIAKVKKYLQSKEFAHTMKKFNDEMKERDRVERLEDIEWWLRIKDTPFGCLT